MRRCEDIASDGSEPGMLIKLSMVVEGIYPWLEALAPILAGAPAATFNVGIPRFL